MRNQRMNKMKAPHSKTASRAANFAVIDGRLGLLFGLLLLTIGLALIPAPAAAAEDLFAQLSAEEEQEVMSLLDEAEDYYDQGRFRAALARFNEAYALFPHPDLLYRIGRCYEQVGNDELAIEHYRQFLEEVPDARERGRIERTIANLEEGLGDATSLVRIETFPIGATLYVDDRRADPVGQTPRDIELPPGTYEIIVEKEGYETQRQSVQLQDGEQLRYQLQLRRQDDDGKSENDPSLAWWKPVGTVTLAALGGVALYQASGHQAQHEDYEAELDSLRGAEGTPEQVARREFLRDESPAERARAVTYGIVGGAAIAGATAFTLWWLLSDSDQSAALHISPGRDGVQVGVHGRF